MVLYKGEYALQYQVNGRLYVIWANAGYMDKDASLVEAKVFFSPCAVSIYRPLQPQTPRRSSGSLSGTARTRVRDRLSTFQLARLVSG
jgi:hypothetical protein